MVFLSAMIGGLTLNIGIATMAILQGMYKGPECKKSREIMLAGLLAAVAGSSMMIILEFIPFLGELGSSIVAGLALLTLAAVNAYAVSQTKVQECGKARLYSIILIIIFACLALLVAILTPMPF